MNTKETLRIAMIGLLALGIGLAPAAQGWAQQAPAQEQATPPTPAPEEDRPTVNALATAAAVFGSLFYIPFKLAIICPGALLASGASLAVTGGDKETADYLLRGGCTGTYFITPQMVRGQEEFRGAGER